MNPYPDEHELISLFECLPIKKNKDELFHYDETSFFFQASAKAYKVMISPFYSRFFLEVKDITEDRVIGSYDFYAVDRMEIITDSRDQSAIRLFMEQNRGRLMTVMEVTFKPNFTVVMREVFV